ncbi:MAG: tetratricopeptide repeat protein, partial [Desulfuromonadales bacterium]|nr:tetratricopeptide repeat protein [Desulfuromonadales bacterium]NIS41387.1 tetratricopeptide repeat protein [Desulfuromonadales bacterium]
ERWDDAIDYFEKAATDLLFAQPEVAWTGYGYAWFMKGEHMRAIDAYIKALEQNPRYAQAYVRRGEVFDSLGKPAK